MIGLGILCQVTAQANYSATLDTDGIDKIYCKLDYASIDILSSDGNTIEIEGYITQNGLPNDKILQVDFSKKGSTYELIFKTDFEESKKSSTDEKIITFFGGKHTKTITDEMHVNQAYQIKLAMKVPRRLMVAADLTYGSISIDSYMNGLDLHSNYGEVKAQLNQIVTSPDVKIICNYGTADVSIPNNTSAQLSMKTDYGSIYSDLDIEPRKVDGLTSIDNSYGQSVYTTLGSGNGSIHIEANYGTIYSRKLE